MVGVKMLKNPDIQRSHPRKSILAASGLLLLFSAQTFAQSGRRTPKPAPSPSIAPTETPEVSSKPRGRALAQKVFVLVGWEPTSKRLLSEDAIASNVVKRLGEFANVDAGYIGELNRDKAIKRAKSEEKAIVILLQYDIDEFQNGTIILNSPDMDVFVRAFEPVSGREHFKGKVYYKAVGGPMMKKDNWPSGTPIRIRTEAVGVEAAEQVHDWLLLEEARKKN
jgi:hypothetical protein